MINKQTLKKVGGFTIVAFVIFAAVLIFPARIHDRNWNAAPFIFSLSFLVVLGISLIKYKK
jgi:ABC-type polysaccharide/polyol phosphate export permease